MFLKLIACEVFMREICHCVARTPHTRIFGSTRSDFQLAHFAIFDISKHYVLNLPGTMLQG